MADFFYNIKTKKWRVAPLVKFLLWVTQDTKRILLYLLFTNFRIIFEF